MDARSGYVHTITWSAVNVHDITETSKLIWEDNEVVYGDSGYLRVEKRTEVRNNENLSETKLQINQRPSSLTMHFDFRA